MEEKIRWDRIVDRPKSDSGGYVIGECNCCRTKNIRVYFIERRYGKHFEKVFNDKLCRDCLNKLFG